MLQNNMPEKTFREKGINFVQILKRIAITENKVPTKVYFFIYKAPTRNRRKILILIVENYNPRKLYY